MKKTFYFLVVMLSISSCSEPLSYPETRKDNVTDNYYGTEVSDPYRWLEDDYSQETMDWVNRQNTFTQSYLGKLEQRAVIHKRLSEVWEYERIGVPMEKGGNTYYFKNNGKQNQSVLYQKTAAGDQVILDPNSFSEDGTAALGSISFSKDARYLAYEVAQSGSDWHQIKIKDLQTNTHLEELIPWVKFSGIAWQEDGFYYSAYDAPSEGEEYSGKNEYHKVYYHQLGTSATEDQLIFEDQVHPQRNFYATTSKDESTLIIQGQKSTSGSSLRIKKAGWKAFKLIDAGFDAEYQLIDQNDDVYVFLTNKNAPNYKLIKIDVSGREIQMSDLVTEGEHVLVNAKKVNDGLILQYTEDVVARLYWVDENGNDKKAITLPGKGTVSGLNYHEEKNKLYFSFENYITPTSIYELNMTDLSVVVYEKPAVDFNSSDYVTKQVFYSSKDGQKIPMFITHKRGVTLNGSNPTFLYGYGGFNIAIQPSFKNYMSVFLEQGGVYAVANIRGGGEYGESWHEAGTQFNKQNVFDDFIAAAEYLIDNNFTNPDKLAVHGRSNGGLLVGAVMTQRPDLFEVCLPGVGVLDMLRYHQFTIGWAWAGDYGRSDDNIAHFKNLYRYSPIHNVKNKAYPATLITTADHDDRVVPAHSFKFAATLQNHQQGDEPVLIRIDVKAGHGAGKPVSMQINEWSDVWAFVFEHLDMEVR